MELNPYLFWLFFCLLYFSYLLSKTMGCFCGCLMSSAGIQKLFCGFYSTFKCSFDEFVEEKVVSPSYSSAILGPLLEIFWFCLISSVTCWLFRNVLFNLHVFVLFTVVVVVFLVLDISSHSIVIRKDAWYNFNFLKFTEVLNSACHHK